MSPLVLGVAALAAGTALVLVLPRLRRAVPSADGPGAGGARLGLFEPPPRAAVPPPPEPWGRHAVVVSSLSDAEEVLDRAEADGYDECELVVLGDATFLVRWRRSA
jgi:hypothetical protein